MTLLDCKILQLERFGVEYGHQPTDALFYVLEGAFSLTIDGETKIVTKNDLVAFPHTMYFERHILSPLKIFYIKLVYPGDMPPGILPIDNRTRLLSSLTFMVEMFHSIDNLPEAEYYLKDIFVQIDTEKQMKTVTQNRVVTATLQYFKEHLTQKVTLPDLANTLGVSVSGLTEHFKKATGYTPIQYLISMRLRLAEELLVTSDATLSEIALLCGYENAFYLSNAFKKTIGESPNSFRKKHRI